MPSKHMGDGNLTDNIQAYELPGVPWVSFFHITGVALHGTYWHNDFGKPRSHGCINLSPQAARWIYRWTQPAVPPEESVVFTNAKTGPGTQIDIA
jgi:lipoprotein-anchoring transpeptidase ErfK/SrfK